MNNPQLKQFLKDKQIIIGAVAGIILWAIAFGIAYVQIFPLGKNLILHLNFGREVDTIGSAKDIAWLLITLAVVFVMNYCIAYMLYYRDRILSYLFLYGTLFVVIVGAGAVYYIASIN